MKRKSTQILVLVAILAAIFYFASIERGDFPAKFASHRSIDEIELKEGVDSSAKSSRYRNSRYGFSFQKPEGYKIGSVPGAEFSESIVVQHPNDTNKSFQIVITPLDQQITLNPDFIISELPGTEISEPLEIRLDNKAQGIMFSSNNDAFNGDSFEIWFSYNGYVYQATSYRAFENAFTEIIGTWKFEV